MKKSVILLLSMMVLVFACKNTKTAQKGNNAVKYRVIASFNNASDENSKLTIAQMESYLISYGKKIKKNITYTKIPWGQGIDFCYALNGLSNSSKKDFVKGLKNLSQSNTSVRIVENSPQIH
ncbi:MAG TPA: hypothetical protein PKZ21_00070 [Bacteroidales bacterium]|nr:hypothetical protein [Bacteroidales bacterium]